MLLCSVFKIGFHARGLLSRAFLRRRVTQTGPVSTNPVCCMHCLMYCCRAGWLDQKKLAFVGCYSVLHSSLQYSSSIMVAYLGKNHPVYT